jgi:hypothetical protein
MENAVEPSLPEHSQVKVFPPVIPLTGFLLGVAKVAPPPPDVLIPAMC